MNIEVETEHYEQGTLPSWFGLMASFLASASIASWIIYY